ncbi:hypothetical protein I4U23_024957 [Adineta vaga]|nr:hypothetical protein I4U23_024957 [Adineta vaga]
MQTIFSLLQKKSDYNLDRARLVGGVGKKTSIHVKFDYDCVIYINNVHPTFENILDEWEEILTLHLKNLDEEIKCTKCSIQFSIQGFGFDILPAPNYAGPNHDYMVQAECVWNKISEARNSSKEKNVSYIYSSGLSELALWFIQKQTASIHDLCRLAKFWNCTVLFKQHVSGRSSFIEYLAVKAGQEEECAAITNKLSILRVFRRFLKHLTDYKQMGIVFNDFYSQKMTPLYKKPFLVDPSNPHNNFLDGVPHDFLPTLSKYAQETLYRLDRCEQNFTVEFEKLFDPQPDFRNIFRQEYRIVPSEIVIGSRQNHPGQSPTLIQRREVFDRNTIEYLKTSMACVLAHLVNTIRDVSEEEIVKKAQSACKDLINRTIYNGNDVFQPTTIKHEDCDITFILPLNSEKKDAMYISMNK